MTEDQLRRRRAIEALRSGVPPGADAVAELGSGQHHVEQEFRDRLQRTVGTGSGGMLIGGGFGSGKSHLLHHFAGLALQDGFVTSRVVVSKGTPLHDPAKVVRSALDEAVMLDHGGPVVEQAAASLDLSGRRFARLVRWTASPEANLDRRFLASLLLYAELRDRDPEYAHALVRFWCGDPVRAPELRRRSRATGRPFTFGRVSPRELAPQRLRFACQLFIAAGAPGWVLLIDEVELVGRYPRMQRAKAYAEIARWLRGMHGGSGSRVFTVLTITDDFATAVLEGKSDREQISVRLARSGAVADLELARYAQEGMSAIEQETVLLDAPDETELRVAYQRLKQLHGAAFDWDPPDVLNALSPVERRMRQHVRAWITEWDLRRLDPHYQVQVHVGDLCPDYAEDPEIGDG